MTSTRLKYEGWLYWLAFLIAIGIRFVQLGASPLSDSEATLALQSLQIARGASPLLVPQPGYTLFTSILFGIIKSTNFMARCIPALAGSVLVFAPYFFRNRIKARPALILAFLFAFDPGLVALSRQSSGTILAVTFTLFAWAMWSNRRAIPTGIFAGLALLSGPSLWGGLLSLGLTWVFLLGMEAKPAAEQSELEASEPIIKNYDLRSSLLTLIATLLLGGTLFFTTPNGLSAWLSSLPAYLKGWTSASVTTPGRTLIIFLAYEPLGSFLAILSIVRGLRTRSRRIVRLGLWLMVSLLLAIFYRETSELAWAIIPLLTLGAMELSRGFDIFPEERVEVGVVVTAVLTLLVYIWFNISNIALNPVGQVTTVPIFGEIQNARYLVLYGSLTIVIVSIALVAFGWSARTARLGATWSFAVFLSVYSLAASWGASGLRSPSGVELWSPDYKLLQADLLLASVGEVSEFSLGHVDSQPVTIMGVNSPALEWLLRDRQVEVVSNLNPQVAPPIVITPLMDDLSLPSAYRGQDFTWRQRPQWEFVQNSDLLRWLVFRQLPLENETIILWVRDDLFPDARENVNP